MAQAEGEMLAACGLDCGPCPIRQIPLDAEAAKGAIDWFKQMGWLEEAEGVAEAIERKMSCSGCQGDRSVHWSSDCTIMLCCVDEKHKQHCGECAELMSCEVLEAFASDEHAHHKEAVERLRQRFGPQNEQAIANIESALATMTAEQGDETMVLEGIDSYRVMGPMFESARVVMSYLGEPYSPAYVQGISGAAFRIGGICPCAPTCACTMGTQDLLKLFGYEIEHLSLCEEGMDPEQEVHRVIERVRGQIRAGRPVLVWHAFTWAEWDVVCGFDDETHQFLGRGSYAGLDGYATADQGRMATCGAICPPIGAILVGDKTGTYDAPAAEIAALQEAVAHAHSTENLDKLDGEGWVMLFGLACYDRWISDFEADPPRLPTMGDRYCFGVNRSTHRAAAGFVCELAAKYPTAKEPLERAAPHFEAEAGALNEAADLVFPGWELPQEPNRETSDKAAALLRTARDNYAHGIDEIENALAALGVSAR